MPPHFSRAAFHPSSNVQARHLSNHAPRPSERPILEHATVFGRQIVFWVVKWEGIYVWYNRVSGAV
jgi:hypothetical protein